MKGHRRNLLLAAVVLIAAGAARMPVERALTDGLRADGLLRPSVEMEFRKKAGQTLWAVSLGGLRTFVATILNLRAFGHFEALRWPQVADTYETIVAFAPHTAYYWDTGAWHMETNAAGYYERAEDLPPLRRRAEARRWAGRGRAFLEEGVRLNPDDWKLWNRLGRLYANPFRWPDYEKAAAAYRRAAASGEALPYVRRAEVFARARIPGKEDEALEDIRRLHEETGGALPRANTLRFVLEHRADPGRDLLDLTRSIFPDLRTAYRHLGDHYLGTRHNFPMDGIAPVLQKLESELAIPAEKSILPTGGQTPNPTEPWNP